MTVKEGEIRYCGPYPMCKMNPLLSSNYHEYLINDKHNSNCLAAWDLMMGVHDLAATIAKLKKAIDKKNGIEPEPEIDTSKLYYNQID